MNPISSHSPTAPNAAPDASTISTLSISASSEIVMTGTLASVVLPLMADIDRGTALRLNVKSAHDSSSPPQQIDLHVDSYPQKPLRLRFLADSLNVPSGVAPLMGQELTLLRVMRDGLPEYTGRVRPQPYGYGVGALPSVRKRLGRTEFSFGSARSGRNTWEGNAPCSNSGCCFRMLRHDARQHSLPL